MNRATQYTRRRESANDLLANRVYNSMQQLGYRQLARVECQSNGSAIVLHGEISSFHLKQIAQTIAAKVPGVQQVINELMVIQAEPHSSR